MSVTIKTNNAYRDLKHRHEVPAKVLASQFDYLNEDDAIDGFFCYHGYWYHVSDFMRVEGNADLTGWDGYASDSAFSGVLIKFSRDNERVKVATYYS